jgi:RES domain-containing protein
MILWRISNHADLLGLGGLYASARWHTRGRPIVYLAESSTAALLETLVHLEVDAAHRPDKYQLLKVQADDSMHVERVELDVLPSYWKSTQDVTQRLGDEWLQRARSALLRVPSAIAPETWNWLLNPRHKEAPLVRILTAEEHRYDWRLFSAK